MSTGRSNRPHFIGIGPEKTGTTWLFQNLQHHPDVWLVPSKATCYFFEHALYPDEVWSSRLALKNDWHHRRYWNYLIQRPGHLLRYPSHVFEPWRVAWDWRYIFDVHDDEWYAWSFGFAKPHQITGEISPPYFFMQQKSLMHMRQLVPEAKLILFIRNPIDWRWSFAKMSLIKNKKRKIDDVTTEEFNQFFDFLKPRSFAKTLTIWLEHFPPKHICVCFFDRLMEDPAGAFGDVCAFLGIDEGRLPTAISKRLTAKINVGQPDQLPEVARHQIGRAHV